jgi:hypothetical protein
MGSSTSHNAIGPKTYLLQGLTLLLLLSSNYNIGFNTLMWAKVVRWSLVMCKVQPNTSQN